MQVLCLLLCPACLNAWALANQSERTTLTHAPCPVHVVTHAQVAELRLLTEEDYKEMSISIGMRRKLLEGLANQPAPVAAAAVGGGGGGSAFGFIGVGAPAEAASSNLSASSMAGGAGTAGMIGLTPAEESELRGLKERAAAEQAADAQEAALSAALNAAASSGTNALAQRPPQATAAYGLSPTVPAMVSGTAMGPSSGVEPLEASMTAVKGARPKAKQGDLAAPFMANQYR